MVPENMGVQKRSPENMGVQKRSSRKGPEREKPGHPPFADLTAVCA
jgi:hypothetical protein